MSGVKPVSLRPYQTDVIQRLRQSIASGERRPLLVAPTGAGKTIIASAITQSAVERGSRVLFLAHRRELIQQAHQKLWASGIDAGVIMAGHPMRVEESVQVASVATLWRRAHRTSTIEPPPADLVVIDEAHRARARTYQKIIESYPEAVILGMTATPCRGDGRGLGNTFNALVECPSVDELIGLGFLVPTVVYAPTAPDLKGVRTRLGDYVESDLAERMDQAELVGDVVTHWHRLAACRKAVVFATGVAHSLHLRNEFRRSGVMAEHIDGRTPTEERDAILRQLSEGVVQVVVNCMVLVEGWDQPSVSCCVLARPTKHMGLYRQMVGRVLRPAPGKADALVLDHAGATFTHGFAEDPVTWTLDSDQRAENPVQAARNRGDRPHLTSCPECDAVRMAGQPCSTCGWKPRQRAEAPEVADGELGRLERDGMVSGQEWNRATFYSGLLWIAHERGYKPGWAAHKFKEKFGNWPPRDGVSPQPATPALRSWVRSRQIAYAKAMKKANAA